MKKCLSNFSLKIIGLISMIFDHIAVIFNPSCYMLFRIVGRISFPIFSFLLVEGYYHSKNIYKYLFRLFIFSIITEIIYDFVIFNKWFYIGKQNILFTLFLGLIMICCLDFCKKCISKYVDNLIDRRILGFVITLLLVGIFGFLAEFLNLDYGMYGIFVIFLFYIFRNRKILLLVSLLFITLIFSNKLQLFMILSLPLIFLYNGKLGRRIKYFFYLCYPLHLVVLYLIFLLK